MGRFLVGLMVFALAAAGCTEDPAGPVVVYTSVTQETVDAVVKGFEDAHPGIEVEVFRAPTGEINARLAAERELGSIEADVLWMTDPLSMYAYRDEGLLQAWTPEESAALPSEFVEDSFWGTRVLHMVVVAGEGVELDSWDDLASTDLTVVLPDPGFAGSAFAALGYFALDPAYGFEFYRTLVDNGAAQVPSPGDVVTGVAEGRFDAGISLDFSVRTALEKGSPIQRIWPAPGAIALYSPIGTVADGGNRTNAELFVEFTLSEVGQALIGETGWVPARPGVSGPPIPPGASEVFPDWNAIWAEQDALLDEYRSIVEG